MKKILFVASEGVPFIKTGGLADVVGSLPKELDKEYYDVRVIMPKYSCMKQEMKDKMEYVTHFYMDFHWKSEYVGVLKAEVEGITFYFIDNEGFFTSDKPYTDDPLFEITRFAFFSKAVLSALPTVDFRPDLIHCHDWQTGLVPVYLKERFAGSAYKDANLLKGGLVYADAITTVSPTYAEEIKTQFYGEGLDGLMNARSKDLRGIINGIDYTDFSPDNDKKIPQPYTVDNFRKMKVKNKLALQKELGLKVDEKCFMIGIVSRLTDQKGFDLIAYVLEEILSLDAIQMVVLGTGEERYENMFRYFDWKYNDKISANIYYSDELSHKIYASSDAFLMPSLFEPCGLSQLMALRYGTLPIVRETGGLKDTVEPYNEFEGTGTGFTFANYNAHEMMHSIRYAEQIYYDRRLEWNKMVERAMRADFSWAKSAAKYQEMYDWLIG